MTTSPTIVAHRGASADAPENTLASYRLALKHDADAIEGDFRLTADGEVVCVHDADFKRFGHDVTVADHTLAELRAYDIGSWKSPAYAGERVATLQEVLALVPAGKHLRLEIKGGLAPLPAIVEVLKKADLPADRVLLMSFDADVVAAAKAALPQYPADWLIWYPKDKPLPTADEVIAKLRSCHATGLGTEARPDAITPAFGHAIRDAGFTLGAWTVNDIPLAKTMLAAGVQAITTDKPGLMKKADFLADI